MTEFKLRNLASAKLGFDLSGTNHKKLVRGVMEAFLLSTFGDEIVHSDAPVPETVAPARNETCSAPAPAVSASIGGEDDRFICKLSDKRNATVSKIQRPNVFIDWC